MNYENPIIAQLDRTLMTSRRAFPEAQAALSGPVLPAIASSAQVGWHDTRVHPETGSVALVAANGPYVSLVGDVVRVGRSVLGEDREVYVYVLETAPLDVDFSLGRRPFLALGLLTSQTLECSLAAVA